MVDTGETWREGGGGGGGVVGGGGGGGGLGLGPCRAGRHAGTVMVSNGHHEREKLCVGQSTLKKQPK